MNILPDMPKKRVPCPSFSATFRVGNFLHTGVVGSSILPSPTTIFLGFCSLERSSQRFTRTREELLPRSIKLPELSRTDWNRFWLKVDRSAGLFGCWPWKAAKSGFGYGRFKIDGKLWSPHRIAASSREGGIPESYQYHGMVVMHSCDNPSCCNPAHLMIATQRDNVVDMDRKGRGRRRPGPRTVSDQTVEAIRAAAGTSRQIASEFGVSRGYVSAIKRGEKRKAAA